MPRGGLNPDGTRRGGRKRGSLNQKTLARLADKKRQIEAIESGEAVGPLDHLLASMNDPLRTPQDRDHAAAAALPYLKPKLSSVDLNARSAHVIYYVSDSEPLTCEQWEQQCCIPPGASFIADRPFRDDGDKRYISGQGEVPPAETLDRVNRLALDLRDRKIETLEAEILKLRDELALAQAREQEARKIPLLS
jgi:hypothetical protein